MSKSKKAKKSAARKATNPRKAYSGGTVERFPFHIRLKEGQGLTYQSFMDANEQLRRQELLEQREREARMPNRFIDERHLTTSEEAVRLFMERLGVTQLQPKGSIFGMPVMSFNADVPVEQLKDWTTPVFSPESVALAKVPNPSNEYIMRIKSSPTGAKAFAGSLNGKPTPVPHVSVWYEDTVQERERKQPAPAPEISYEFGFTDNPNHWKELKSLNRRDEFHRRAQKAEGASKYLWKSVRRYQDMLEKAYYLIGVEIGRGTRFMVDPVPLIKDAPLMNAFKDELHRGYRDGENLSPEHHVTASEQSGLHISITEAKE